MLRAGCLAASGGPTSSGRQSTTRAPSRSPRHASPLARDSAPRSLTRSSRPTGSTPSSGPRRSTALQKVRARAPRAPACFRFCCICALCHAFWCVPATGVRAQRPSQCACVDASAPWSADGGAFVPASARASALRHAHGAAARARARQEAGRFWLRAPRTHRGARRAAGLGQRRPSHALPAVQHVNQSVHHLPRVVYQRILARPDRCHAPGTPAGGV